MKIVLNNIEMRFFDWLYDYKLTEGEKEIMRECYYGEFLTSIKDRIFLQRNFKKHIKEYKKFHKEHYNKHFTKQLKF